MILLITNKFDPHVDSVILCLEKKKIDFERINTEEFPQRLGVAINHHPFKSFLYVNNRKIALDSIKSIWYRRPLPPEPHRSIKNKAIRKFIIDESESVLFGLWESIDCHFVDRPSILRRAENKIYQLKLAEKLGLLTPQTLITNRLLDLKNFTKKCKSNLAIKTIFSNVIDYPLKSEVIFTNKLLKAKDIDEEAIEYSPHFFQEYIEKAVELRAIIMGQDVFTFEILSQESKKGKYDWRRDLANLKYRIHNLPASLKRKYLNFVKMLGLNFGVMDLILTPDKKYVFLELNPNGAWLWLEKKTGFPLSQKMAKFLIRGK